MSEFTKYNEMENILHQINKKFVALDMKEERRCNIILHAVIDQVVLNMRSINALFDKLYSKFFYGGSYYDGLKVGKPDEFDIDLLLKLPKEVNAEVEISTKPGFVTCKLGNPESLALFCETTKKGVYLDADELLSWVQSILYRALSKYKSTVKRNDSVFVLYGLTVSKAGPAFTLHINANIDGEHCLMDVDLVTCIEFEGNKWPKGGYRTNPYEFSNTISDRSFFIVPKCPKNIDHTNRYWRLSFQAQERKLITGKEKLKPALRLLKKMRNKLNQPIASYHLKTIVLLELDTNSDIFSQKRSLSFVFMHILKLYKDKILDKKIQYYWNKKLNLIDSFHESTYINIGHNLENIIRKIDANPLVIKKYLLDAGEILEEEEEDEDEEILEEEQQSGNLCTIL